MRNGDIIFFGVIILALILLFTFPNHLTVPIWLLLIAPIAIAKAFFPNSKFTTWLEKKFAIKKKK